MFLDRAKIVAELSNDTSTKVGCVVVKDGEILVEGWNDFPAKVENFSHRRERPTKYLFTAHAEESAINLAAKLGIALDGCDIYVTHLPCAKCMRGIIQSGIKAIYYGSGTTSMPNEEFDAAIEMAQEAGIERWPLK